MELKHAPIGSFFGSEFDCVGDFSAPASGQDDAAWEMDGWLSQTRPISKQLHQLPKRLPLHTLSLVVRIAHDSSCI